MDGFAIRVADAGDPAAPLSPARQILAGHLAESERLRAEVDAAAEAERRALGFVEAETAARAELDRLDAEQKAAAKAWAVAGAHGEPPISDPDRLDAAKAKLASAEGPAAAARQGLAVLRERLDACRQSGRAASIAIMGAAHEVLGEAGDAIVAEIRALERQAARKRGELNALVELIGVAASDDNRRARIAWRLRSAILDAEIDKTIVGAARQQWEEFNRALHSNAAAELPKNSVQSVFLK